MANGDPVKIGQNNFGSAETLLQATVNAGASTFVAQVGAGSTGNAITAIAQGGTGLVAANLTNNLPGIRGSASGGLFGAIFGNSQGVGVRGHGSQGVVGQGGLGVGGISGGPSGVGVSGELIQQGGVDQGGAGVIGRADVSPGVIGRSDSGAGVRGASVSAPGALATSDSAPGLDASSRSAAGAVGRSQFGTGVHGISDTGMGVTGTAALCGVRGEATSGFGLYGTAQEGDGVRGESSGGWGVVGFGRERPGVGARSQSGAGVDAGSSSGPGVIAAGGTFGVTATAVRGIGVRGECANGAAGVRGVGPRGAGVHGDSAGGYGVVGSSVSGVGVAATTAGTLPALMAYGTGTGRAGQFLGDVDIWGTLTVGGVKSAAVRHPDGSLRRLHCLESPEPLFEDVGEAELVDGRAKVKLDPDFAALVDVDGYHVLLTSYAPVALYVSRRDSEAFEIAVVSGDDRPPAEIRCAWRVVARRRDVEPGRLTHVDEPERRDVLADLRRAGEPEPARPGRPATARVDAPPAPPAPAIVPFPAPSGLTWADPSELDR